MYKMIRVVLNLVAVACLVASSGACSRFAIAIGAEFHGAPYQGDDIFSDTWVATDGAGRKAPGFAECGSVKADKWTGIFYWTWHRPTQRGPHDNTRLLASAKNGKINWPEPGNYHWGEPELGYYLMTDPFVIRKHASMLVDAGIDVILFDTTNPPQTSKMSMRRFAGSTPLCAKLVFELLPLLSLRHSVTRAR
jgi:hypothetical protein